MLLSRVTLSEPTTGTLFPGQLRSLEEISKSTVFISYYTIQAGDFVPPELPPKVAIFKENSRKIVYSHQSMWISLQIKAYERLQEC